MRILVSNDDGIYSPGLAVLARAAAEFGEVRVVAPDMERSSAGHSITSTHPLTYRATTIAGLSAYRVNGTPADCVALGMYHWDHVDVVLSGLNIGLNLGNAVWHSGTVAAAKQATLLGARGIALSAPASQEADFSAYAPWLQRVLQTLLVEVDPGRLVNVNLPREPRGLMWTNASVDAYDGRIVPARDPMDREVYWFTVTPLEAAEKRTDRWAVEQHWISMTPLELDVTDRADLDRLRAADPLDEHAAEAMSPLVSSPRDAASVRADEAHTAAAPGLPDVEGRHRTTGLPPTSGSALPTNRRPV
ncbi:MAG: 5'/3'-nucleotidase SurE [Acidobacteria bacterium]|nr:5'/3'-nucleotidase SurE [Acidobacteriota bacterium]